MTILLASTSPRRRDLLSRLGLSFEIVPSVVNERAPRRGEVPIDYALALAFEKVAEVARRRPGCVVLGADTVVAVDNLILGKPADTVDAVRMLTLLRGRWHMVATAVAVFCGEFKHGAVAADVLMRSTSDEEIAWYVATGETMDKAGAYAVQGIGGKMVADVVGCYETVVGLPLCLVRELLTDCGISVPQAQGCSHRP